MKWIYKQPHQIQKSYQQIFEFVIKSPTISLSWLPVVQIARILIRALIFICISIWLLVL